MKNIVENNKNERSVISSSKINLISKYANFFINESDKYKKSKINIFEEKNDPYSHIQPRNTGIKSLENFSIKNKSLLKEKESLQKNQNSSNKNKKIDFELNQITNHSQSTCKKSIFGNNFFYLNQNKKNENSGEDFKKQKNTQDLFFSKIFRNSDNSNKLDFEENHNSLQEENISSKIEKLELENKNLKKNLLFLDEEYSQKTLFIILKKMNSDEFRKNLNIQILKKSYLNRKLELLRKKSDFDFFQKKKKYFIFFQLCPEILFGLVKNLQKNYQSELKQISYRNSDELKVKKLDGINNIRIHIFLKKKEELELKKSEFAKFFQELSKDKQTLLNFKIKEIKLEKKLKKLREKF
jgi:hypothetical protein